MYNAIAIFALGQNAEQILKYAERILRHNWNLYGFKRIGSGYQTIMTDGFGNPYSHERELKLFGIAIEVPEGMDYRTAQTYLSEGARRLNYCAEYYFTCID